MGAKVTLFLAVTTLIADLAVGAAAYAMAVSNRRTLALITTLIKQHDERITRLEGR
jgi:hypothetical protein